MKKTIIIGAICSAFSLTAVADTPSFNYVNLGYVTNIDFNGFGIKGNVELNDSFYINAEYQSIDSLLFGFSVKNDFKALGIGYKKDISSDTTFFTEFNGVRVKSGVNGFGSSNEKGYQAVLGVRSNVNSNFEVITAVNYLNVVGGGNTSLQLGGLYKFNKSAGWYFNVDTDFSGSSYNTGIRFTF